MTDISDKGMKIAIVGSGAVGSYYGCKLALDNRDVHFYLRTGYETVQRKGFEIRQDTDSFYLHPAQVYASTTHIGACDLVIVALKATANSMLRELLSPLIKPDTSVLTLQNGLGNLEQLAELVPAEQILGGLCFVCINRVQPGVIENYLPGQLFIGAYHDAAAARVDELVSMFCRAGVDCSAARSLEASLWKKLCWNVPFNGLAIAGGGITTDIILQSEPLKELARTLMEEVRTAAGVLGHDLSDAFLQHQFDVTASMGPYKPSSLIDYLEGRAVEIEAIFGEPLRRGEAADVPMPALRTLYCLLQHLVHERG